MPAPAVVGVYVLAAVGSVAAGLAFKEFVYEPHIAPRVERWAEEFLAKRKAKRARRAVAVPSGHGADAHGDDDAGTTADGKSTYELESLVENEVQQWRSQVVVSSGSGLRHRRTVVGSSATGSALDESNIIIPYSPLSPTHVLFDPTDGLSVADSPTSAHSAMSSRVPTPSPHGSSLLSHLTFRTPPPPQQPAGVRAPPTPEPSARGRGSPAPLASPLFAPSGMPTPTPATNTQAHAQDAVEDPFSGSPHSSFASPHHVPSLSLSHPLDLDAEPFYHDLELLSAPSESSVSSRPDSPFSELSHPTTRRSFGTFSPDGARSPFVLSPELRTLSSESGSEMGDEAEGWSNAGSEISGSSWASAGVGRR
ncbi:hypothetical protein C8F04DRAFT_1118801 [Mycena alexandri]|uniref:Uncharacterized protein n=1 Tax=Mycena alexandri TaxID=1745969 RepID=A0AAD6WXT1_9AGAR|nr:hypothetical protein C8F04DRAFT_1118801 [Mycena alexandri]